MSEKVRIGEMFIPILPKKYRQQENYVNCDDVLCAKYDIDCDICPLSFHKVKEETLDIIECNQKLIEVNLCKDYWGISELPLSEIKKYGIRCCDIQCSNVADEMECFMCRFNNGEIHTLDELKYKELEQEGLYGSSL